MTAIFAVPATASASLGFVQAPGSPFRVTPSSPYPGPIDLATGDVDKDGNPDLVTVNYDDGTATVLLGDGTGGFATNPAGTFTVGSQPNSLAIDDLDGDSNLDLAITNQASGITLRYGNGEGGFPDSVNLPMGPDPRSINTYSEPTPDGPVVNIVVANFANSGTGNVSVLRAGDDRTFSPLPGSPFLSGHFEAAANFEDGGVRKIAAVDYDGGLWVLRADQDTFETVTGSPFPGGYAPVALAPGDFNGDGLSDLAAADLGEWPDPGYVNVMLAETGGGYTPAAGNPFDLGSQVDGPFDIVTTDFDGDGNLDLATANDFSEDVSVLLGDGAGGFALAPFSPLGAGNGAGSLVAGDLNHDEGPDLAIANSYAGTVTVRLNRPDLILDPLDHDFGTVDLGTGPGTPITFTVDNTGGTEVEFSTIATTDPQFVIEGETCTGQPLAPQGSCEIEVAFAPASEGIHSGTLQVGSNGPVRSAELSGTGRLNPGLTLTPAVHDFGTRDVGSGPAPPATFELKSSGTTPVTVESVSLEDGTGQFELQGESCAGRSLAPGDSCPVQVGFLPSSAGTATAGLEVVDDAPGSPRSAALTALAVAPPPPPPPPPRHPHHPHHRHHPHPHRRRKVPRSATCDWFLLDSRPSARGRSSTWMCVAGWRVRRPGRRPAARSSSSASTSGRGCTSRCAVRVCHRRVLHTRDMASNDA